MFINYLYYSNLQLLVTHRGPCWHKDSVILCAVNFTELTSLSSAYGEISNGFFIPFLFLKKRQGRMNPEYINFRNKFLRHWLISTIITYGFNMTQTHGKNGAEFLHKFLVPRWFLFFFVNSFRIWYKTRELGRSLCLKFQGMPEKNSLFETYLEL